MSLFFNNRSVLFVVFFIGVLGYSQTKKEENDTLSTEKVVIVKTFNPTINDAFKIHPEPNFDEKEASIKEPLKFQINSVPVASTFVPEKTKSIAVKKEAPEASFKNYALLGAGNFGNVLAEVFSSIDINKESQFTALLEHQSSQGGIKKVRLDDFFYDTGVQLSFGKQQKRKQWTIDLEAQHQLYNWYGLSSNLEIPEEQFNAIDPSHSFIDVNLGGNLQLDHEVFNTANVRFRHFRDDYESTENNLKLNPKFTAPLDDYPISIPIIFDYLSGEFADNNVFQGSKYSFLILGVQPTIALNFKGVDVKIGVSGFLSNDFENSELKLTIHPNLTANYNFNAYNLSVFGGATGGLKQNTYHEAIEKNPFVAPGIGITPTNQVFNAFGGVQGQWQEKFSYMLKGEAEFVKDYASFIKNPILNSATENLNYGFNNSFGYFYQDYVAAKITAEVGYEEQGLFNVLLQTTFARYNETPRQPLNIPAFTTSARGNYIVNSAWSIGANIFYVGVREDRDRLNSDLYTELDGYFDLNLRADYKITDQWSAFALGNNLTGQNYERWLDYPVQGIQLLVGAKYKF
ncbi:TonB-dependent receptor [Aquimarina agarilytica]|uniref:TonB-dependent receptor n=1 Tax=Aquimarina agarilytica TaxID=1087449 RepID=UPI00028A3BE0|nr:TonB-dependent receptor [Aquimarina agarilytica]